MKKAAKELYSKMRDGILITLSCLLYMLIFSIPYCFGQSLGAPPERPPKAPNPLKEGGEKDACLKILSILTPKRQSQIKLRAYASVRKDYTLGGSSTYITQTPAGLSCGINLEIPLIDKAEEYALKKERLTNAKAAQSLLQNYLELKTEVENGQKLLAWLWERVNYGIEYRKDIWPKQIELSKKKARLQSLIETFKYLGISETLLNKCYLQTCKRQK